MLDIKIIEQHHTQAVLFGPPIKITTYLLVDCKTGELVDEFSYDSIGAAERATYNRLRPHLRQMAAEEAERSEG